MTGSAAPGGKSVLAASIVSLAAVLSMAACGSNGSSEIGTGPPDPPVIAELTGIVCVPRSIVETDPNEPGNCLSNEVAFGIRGAHVTLSSLTEADAADGRIDFYDPVVQAVPTDADGRYQIISDFVETYDVCQTINNDRFIGRMLVSVSVGDPNLEGFTRAFVVSSQTNIDASSEAVVRLVLERIFEYEPPVQLCDFSIEGLRDVVEAAKNAAFTAQGDTVGEINEDAYRLASENCKVTRAIDSATGIPADPPMPCVRG